MRRHNPTQTIREDLVHGQFPDVAVSAAEPVLITSGPMLCRLRIWTEAEWAMLPEAERPAQYTHALGLGWVGAIPTACLN
jgi:hypothetical protein